MEVDKAVNNLANELTKTPIERKIEYWIDLADKGVNVADKAIKVVDQTVDVVDKGLDVADKGIDVWEKGANAVISVSMNYEVLGKHNSMLMVTAS